MTEEEKNSITREKHPGRITQGRNLAALMEKERKRYCATKNSLQSNLQYSLQNSIQYSLQYSQMKLIFIALVHLLPLSLAFAYFLRIKLLRLQTKNKSVKKGSTTKTTSYALDMIIKKTLYNK